MIRNYVKLHSSIWTNPKFLGLSSDTARLAYVRCISAGNESEPNGQWIDRSYLAAAIGRKCAAFIPELVASTLLVEDDDEVIRLRQWKLWQGRDRWSADELDAIDPDKAEVRRKNAADRQKRKYWRDKGRAEATSLKPHANLTQPHVPLNERKVHYVTREASDAAITPDASEREACLQCGRRVPGLAGNMTAKLRDTGQTFRVHAACALNIIDEDGGLDPSMTWTDYDDAGYPIMDPIGA